MASKDSKETKTAGPAQGGIGMVPLAVLIAVLGKAREISDTLTSTFGEMVLDPLRKLMWGNHIPALARAGADTMNVEPALFSWLNFSGDFLAALEQQVQKLTEIQSVLIGLLDYVNSLVAVRKDELYRKTTDLVDGLNAALASPMTPPDVKARLRDLSKIVQTIVDSRNQGIQDTKHTHDNLVAPLQAQVEQLTQEINTLRGATHVLPPSPSKKGSRQKKH